MKNLITPLNLLYVFLISVIANGFLLLEMSLYWLFAFVPVFLFINIFCGTVKQKTPHMRIKICHHGAVLLTIFTLSLIPSFIYHTVLGFILIPRESGKLFVLSLVYCICVLFFILAVGTICVFFTSKHMGLKWRVVGILFVSVPILNLLVMNKIISVVYDEVEYELEKARIEEMPELRETCKTKYPILLVHGVFFRDSNLINYWGRIPKSLKLRGATIYYGSHQSALAIKDSALELASRIKFLVERSGCEKINIIAHSKGGLDCRYAISEYGIAPYVASLTTINTPHRGCLFADNLLNVTSDNLKRGVSSAYNAALTELGDESPDFMAAVKDLTSEGCKALNEKLAPFPADIFAQSVGSVMSHPTSAGFPFNISYNYVKNFDGENDGLVGESSFSWGEKYTLLRTEGKHGISHGDMIDLARRNIKTFDVRKFYINLVADLKERGL